jgi:hypothetical protein
MGKVHGGAGHADCFTEWRGAVGPHHGLFGPREERRQPGTAHALVAPWVRSKEMLTGGGRKNVVTEEAVPGGARGRSGSVRVEKAGFCKRRKAGRDTVFAIGKTKKEETDKQTGVLGCGSTRLERDRTYRKRELARHSKDSKENRRVTRCEDGEGRRACFPHERCEFTARVQVETSPACHSHVLGLVYT